MMDRFDDRTPLWDYSDNRSPDDGLSNAGRWDRARAEEAARAYVAAEGDEHRRYGDREREERFGEGYARGGYPRDEGRSARGRGNYGRVPRRGDDRPPAYSDIQRPRRAVGSERTYRGAQNESYGDGRGMDFWPSEFGYPPVGYSPYGPPARSRRPDYDGDDRGFFDRAGDELLSWFGDRDARRRRERDHRGRGPKNYARSDDRIREDVNDRLTDDVWIDASDIEVSVADGEVTLAGTVEDRSTKRRAEDCADGVSGVKHVQNNLRYASGIMNSKED